MLLIIEQLWPPCRLIVLRYCSSMSSSHIILLIIEQLRLLCRLIVASLPLPLYCGILLLAKQHDTKRVSILYCSSMSSFCIILLIIEQLRLPCSSWSSYCNSLYPCSLLYLSQWELAKLYWCVVWRGLGAWWLPCHYMTSLSFIAASCWLLWLRPHANFTAVWAAAATSISSYIFIVASPDATSTPLLWDYAAMKAVWDHTRSFLRHHADFDCGITANSIHHLVGRLAASSPSWIVVL
jgi:hypothetical protein